MERSGRSFSSAPSPPLLQRFGRRSRTPSIYANGAHSRRCSGSVSAFQTFAGGEGRARTRTSVHFSPSFRTSAPEAAPGAYCSRPLMSFLSFHRGHLLHLVQVLLQGIDVL